VADGNPTHARIHPPIPPPDSTQETRTKSSQTQRKIDPRRRRCGELHAHCTSRLRKIC
jgi:hypothetical protein